MSFIKTYFHNGLFFFGTTDIAPTSRKQNMNIRMLQGFCSWFAKSSWWSPAHQSRGAPSRVCSQGHTAPVIHRRHTQHSLESRARTRISIIYCFHHIPPPPKALCLLCLEVKPQTQQPEAGGAPGWDGSKHPFPHCHIPRNCIPR